MEPIRLTAEEVQRYKLRPDEYIEFELDPRYNERDIHSTIHEKVDKVLDQFQIDERHRNYLRWATSSLMLTIQQPVKNHYWDEYGRAVKFCQGAISEPPFQIKLGINGKELHLTHNADLMNSLYDTLRHWLMEYAKKHPGINDMPRGRPKGEANPGKEASLKNMAENLIQVIGMKNEDAREMLYQIGLIVGTWQDQGEKRKKIYKCFK